jgi:hypothetical protein
MQFRVVPEDDISMVTDGGVDVSDDGDAANHDIEEEDDYITNLMVSRYKSLIKSDIPTSTSTTHSTIVVDRRGRKGIMEIDNLQKSELYNISYDGKYFVFLMSLPQSVPNKTDSHIGYTPNPIANVYMYNEKFIFDRSTSMAAPNWELDIVMGPFICKKAAHNCANAWVNGTRGKESKRSKALYLSSVYNVNIYTYQKKCERSLEELLKENADPQFVDILLSEVVSPNKL